MSNVKHCELSIQENMAVFSQKSLFMYWFLVKTIYWVLLSSISYQLMLLVFHTNFDWLLCYPLNILRIYSNKNYLKVDITNFWYNQHEIGILGINFRFFSLIANLLWNIDYQLGSDNRADKWTFIVAEVLNRVDGCSWLKVPLFKVSRLKKAGHMLPSCNQQFIGIYPVIFFLYVHIWKNFVGLEICWILLD